ncbi:hypothetical protein Efla_001970 [Eimeria flavescens]
MARAVVYFCTGNENKLKEVKQMMDGVPVEFKALDVDLPELQGEPADIAKAKCLAALEAHQKASSSSSSNSNSSSSSTSNGGCLPEFIFTEDTALCFNALGGLPGPYVKWFLKAIGSSGLPKLLAGFEDKSAYALTTVCLADPQGQLHLFEGRCDGSIVEPRGKTTFGWDCVFEERSSRKTFGEMETKEKGAVSHRGRAMRQLKAVCLSASRLEDGIADAALLLGSRDPSSLLFVISI